MEFLKGLVMCDNDFTTLSIIMTILSRYNSYITIVQQIVTTTELPLKLTSQIVTSKIHT